MSLLLTALAISALAATSARVFLEGLECARTDPDPRIRRVIRHRSLAGLTTTTFGVVSLLASLAGVTGTAAVAMRIAILSLIATIGYAVAYLRIESAVGSGDPAL